MPRKRALDTLAGAIGRHHPWLSRDLRKRVVEHGAFMAVSTWLDGGEPRVAHDNYFNVWARDGSICVLAAIATDEPGLLRAAERTLHYLWRYPGPDGQLPSNVSPAAEPSMDGVSYGGSAGRMDATPWAIIALCSLALHMKNATLFTSRLEQVEAALRFMRAAEGNVGGLMLSAPTGSWDDQYIRSGYLLDVNILRWLALRWVSRLCRELGIREPTTLRSRFKTRDGTWFEGPDQDRVAEALQGFVPPGHSFPACFTSAFHPAGTFSGFDAMGNALACLAGLHSREFRLLVLRHGESLLVRGLLPAFHPQILPCDPEYEALKRGAGQGPFRCIPGRYHNGGCWPVVSGIWAMALRAHGMLQEWQSHCRAIERANDLERPFCEFMDANDGSPGGTYPMAWSAAGEILATAPVHCLVPPS